MLREVSITNEQKSLMQQRSHLTVTLAKQLKEAGQGLDRLADESHLLPTYPIPDNIPYRKGLEAPASFGDEVSKDEKPDSSRRARSWTFAAESASAATNNAILEKIQEGRLALLGADQILLGLRNLGAGGNGDDRSETGDVAAPRRTVDIWSTLDGHLGVIKMDDGHSS